MSADQLEYQLFRDLGTLDERLDDEEFASELYRALANRAWTNGEGHVSLSWRRAEEVVNELRARRGREALPLAQTGGEGNVSDLVGGELGRLSWRSHAFDAHSHDPQHRTRPEAPPPPEQGERFAPVEDAHAWERLAHEEAERHRRPTTPLRPPRPPV
jgi:hypothetical protein